MEWMERRNVQFYHGDHALLLDLIAKTKGIVAAENHFTALPPMAKNKFTYGSLLNCYCTNLMKAEALALFKQMDELNLIDNHMPLNNLMSLYLKLGQPEEVLKLVDELTRRNLPRNSFIYIFLLQSYADLNDMDGLERVVEELSNDVEENSNWITYRSLASIYIKAGQFEKAEVCLRKLERDKMPSKREAYHYLISLYAATSNQAEVYRVWEAMKRAFPTVHNMSYIVMLDSLAKLKDFEGLKRCFEDWESSCSSYDMRLATRAIRLYLSGDMLEEALNLYWIRL